MVHIMKNGRNAQHMIGEYLLRRVSDLGVGHVFGAPGNYVLAPALRPMPMHGYTALEWLA
jgi:TPP-dependent 2-oxoacid decarboxylase